MSAKPHEYAMAPLYVEPHNPEMAAIRKQRGRLFDNLNRFVRAKDCVLSDEDFVVAVFGRWVDDRGTHLGDPGDGPSP
jgi:hypothetical protein